MQSIWDNLASQMRSKEKHAKKDDLNKCENGLICPRCKQSRMDYDGTLTLVCKACGYSIGGSYT